MTTAIEAIETSYAGCRFRSRLEARWAVFFDHARIKWEYEPQGYFLGEDKRPYLPDFWLPGLGTWVEVKGEMAALDVNLMDRAVCYPGGLPKSDSFGELGILILGPVPEPGVTPLHWRLSRTVYAPCKSGEDFCACYDLHYSQQAFRSIPGAVLEVPEIRAAGVIEHPGCDLLQVGRTLLTPVWDDIVTARPFPALRPDPRVDAAYRAARSARFEHGERPPVPADEAGSPRPVGKAVSDRLAALLEQRVLPGDSA